MEAANLGRIVEDLQSEEVRLSHRRQELQQGLDAIDVELQRVQAGVSALTGRTTTKGKNSKQSPTKDVVRDAMRNCLREQEVLDPDALKAAVGEQVKAAGYSRVGMALRLKEVLEEAEFNSSAPPK